MLAKEPNQIRVGETIVFAKTFSDYSADDGYILKYKIIGAGGIADASVTSTGIDHVITFPNSVTKLLAAGIYNITGWFEKGAGPSFELHPVFTQSIELLADITGSTAIDIRSDVRIILDNIIAAIKTYATNPVIAISIAGRTYQRPSLLQLELLRKKYQRLVQDEIDTINLANGLGRKKILQRFDRVS